MNISLGIQLLINLKMNSNLQNGLTKKKKGNHRLKRLPEAGLICKSSSNIDIYYIKAKAITICTTKCMGNSSYTIRTMAIKLAY